MIIRLCVFCRQICRCHTLYLQGILDLRHVLSKMVNRLMGHVMKAGLKHAALHLRINLMHFMHSWYYAESLEELKFQEVLLQVLNL